MAIENTKNSSDTINASYISYKSARVSKSETSPTVVSTFQNVSQDRNCVRTNSFGNIPKLIRKSASSSTMSSKDTSDASSPECPSTPKNNSKRSSNHLVELASPGDACSNNTVSTSTETFSPYNNPTTFVIPSSPAKRIAKKSLNFNRLIPPKTPDRSSNNGISPTVGGFNASNLNTPIQFMSPSKVYSDEILHSDEKLQKISNNLKTKLSTAFSKIQHSKGNNNNGDDNSITNNGVTINSIFIDHEEDHEYMRLSNRGVIDRNSKHKSLPNYLHSPSKTNITKPKLKMHVQSASNKPATLLEPFNNGSENTQSSPLTSPKKRKQRAIIINKSNRDLIPTYKFDNEDSMLSANDAFQEAINKSSPTKKSRRIVKSISTGFADESSSSLSSKFSNTSQHSPFRDDDYDDIDHEDVDNNNFSGFEDERRKEKEAVQSLLSLSCSPLKRKKSFNSYNDRFAQSSSSPSFGERKYKHGNR